MRTYLKLFRSQNPFTPAQLPSHDTARAGEQVFLVYQAGNIFGQEQLCIILMVQVLHFSVLLKWEKQAQEVQWV